MVDDTIVYVGLDVAKASHAVAVAESGRQGEVRFMGEVSADPDIVRRLIARLKKKHGRLHFCYEAGPTGYGLYRQLIQLGHRCSMVAPSMIPRKPGDRIKTNRRDAIQLARLLRAGELTEVLVPAPPGRIASVKVVEKWVEALVAIDHAVAVEILVVSASMMGASSSAIGSVCM